MRLRTVNVKYYRCLADVSVDISDLTVLLGPNSTGKSSLLHALRFFFDGGELEAADVFGGLDEAISVECIFDELNEADRAALGPYGAGDQVVLRRSWRYGEEQKLTGRGRRFPAFADIRNRSGRERTAAYKALREAQPDLGLPTATNIDAVNQAMLTFEQNNPGRCVAVDDEDASQLFGYKSVGKSKLAERFTFVFVPAINDAPEEAVERRGSLLSKLLTAVAEQRVAANEQLKTIETEARAKYEEAVATSHGPVLTELGGRLSEQIRRYVPSAEIKLEPMAANFSIAPPIVGLRGGEEQELTDLGRQGHGFQRAFVISVLEYLADVDTIDTTATQRPQLLLAIEEPELYQHPPRARHFFRTLSTIARGNSVQVCYATHSPYFLSPEQFDSVRIFRRDTDDEGGRGAIVTTADLEVVDDKLPESATADARTYLARTLSAQFCEGFFARGVLLVEGPTDMAIFETAADLLGLGSLASDGVAITPVGGKGSQPIALAILVALGIPTFCVFDGDANSSDEVLCDTCGRTRNSRTAAIRSNRQLLMVLGATPTDFPETTVTEQWACFHTELEDSIPELPRRLVEVQDEMGWKGKSPEAYSEALRRIGAEALPGAIAQIVINTRNLAGL
jgi:putative ATP-dependent endonuclease of the OLD family